MQLPIKGKREKESISEIRSKPIPADVTAKTALISPSVCTAVQNRRRPRPVSLKAAISAQTNTPERAEPIAGHPAPGTLRFGRAEPCRRLRIRPYPPQGQSPTLPHRSDASGASVGTASPTTRGGTPVLCHSQNVRACPRKRQNNVPGSSGRNACALPFAERAVVSAQASEPQPQQQRTERLRSAICRM